MIIRRLAVLMTFCFVSVQIEAMKRKCGTEVSARTIKRQKIEPLSLHKALQSGFKAVKNALQTSDIDINKKGSKGYPFVWKMLHDVNLNDKQKRCLLHSLLEKDIFDLTADLPGIKTTVLHLMVNRGKDHYIKDIVSQRPQAVHLRDGRGCTPLHCCFGTSQEYTIKSPEHFVNIARILVAAEADLNAKDLQGNTPLHCVKYDKAMVAYLIACEADVTILNNDGKRACD